MALKTPAIEAFSLHVTIYIAPENLDKFFEAFKPVFNLVTAEPECLFFEMYQDPGAPGILSWVENWSKSPEWFMKNQMTKQYYAEYFAITTPMFLQPREFKIMKRLGPPFVIAKPANFE